MGNGFNVALRTMSEPNLPEPKQDGPLVPSSATSLSPVTPVVPPPAEEIEMSLFWRLINLFVAPSELFDHIALAPTHTVNWFLPLILNWIAVVFFTLAAFSNSAVIQEMRDLQASSLNKQVENGKMTAAQRDGALETIEKFSKLTPIFGSISGVVAIALFAFITSGVIWLIANKVFRANVEFAKAMEIYGLASLVSVPGTFVKLALVTLRGSINVGVNPGFFFSDVPVGSPASTALAAVDLFILWLVLLISLGVAKVTRRSLSMSAAWFGGLWLVFALLFTGISALTYSK